MYFLSGSASTEAMRIDSSGIVSINNTVEIGANATFVNNGKALFGNGAELEIYQDGVNSFIKDTGTGSLELRSNFFKVKSTVAEDMIWAQENAGVSLFHNNILKLATTSAGVTVNGRIKADEGVQVGNETSTTASLALVGTLRYRGAIASGLSTVSVVEMCMQTGSSTFAWEVIYTTPAF